MKLWLLNRVDDIGYDEYTGYVVAADTENDARYIAAQNCADEGAEVWQDLRSCVAECIASKTDQKEGIVLRSFNAG